MIDAKDLRLNNIVQVGEIIGKVDWIQKESISVTYFERQENLVNGIITHEETLQPIPLTPEILEKCGFAIISNPNHTNSFLCYTPMMKLVLVPERKTITLRDYSGVQRSITYLHDLQNLTYALTKQELEYKP